jgi:hypothetical protein
VKSGRARTDMIGRREKWFIIGEITKVIQKMGIFVKQPRSRRISTQQSFYLNAY